MSTKKEHAVIIGSGLGGIATAILLAKSGMHVDVYEKNATLGGRANVFEVDGFRFDMGPSWYLMPDIFEQFFNLIDEDIREHLPLQKLSPSYRVFFKDEDEPQVVDIFSDFERDKQTFEKLEVGSSEKLKTYLQQAKKQYNTAVERFIHRNYNTIFDFLTPEIVKAGIQLSVFKKMDQFVRRYFSSDKVQKIMQYPLVFLGSSPYNTPALYSIMSHIDFSMGVYYPKDGIYAIVETLVRIAKKHGVTFHTNAPITRIVVEQGKATGVEVNGQTVMADYVISNADPEFTERALLEPSQRDHKASYWESRTLAPSAFIMYLGVKDCIPSLTHHNLLFSKDWKKNFGEIFDSPAWPNDPSLYICAPSKTDTTVAPENHENLFVLVPIAAGLKDTTEVREAYADKMLHLISTEMDIPNLKDRIVYQRIFTVSDFQKEYHSYKGTALGLAHTMKQTAVFRPNNVSKKVQNLYYAGANTNPGIGMPMCLISAQLVYKRIKNISSPEPLEHL